jgi:hypothetical protein
MSANRFGQLRLIGTLSVLVFILLHLGLEYFQGGIRSHHMLNRADLPEISNLWGLLLPLLAWFLLGTLAKRLAYTQDAHAGKKALLSGVTVLSASVALIVSFELGQSAITEVIFQGLLLAAVFLPFYRAEFFLAVALGMTFAFGAILPSGVATVLATIAAISQLLLWPLLQWCWRLMRPAAQKSSA